MKHFLTLLATLIAVNYSYAQNAPLFLWGTGLDGSTYQKTAIYSDTSFGLLFEAPLDAAGVKLPIEFNWRGSGVTPLKINPNGNVGIGTTSPFARLHVQNDTYTGTVAIGHSQYPGLIASSALTGEFRIDNRSSSIGYITFYPNGEGTTVGTEAMRINAAGKVGIGTTSPDELLSVNGTIHSKEVKVNLTGLPDYVFKPDYCLPTLSEVKTYIDKNSHLPEIPSAQEVEKNGLNLGEMNKLLLKKVEELTLYLLEQKQEIDKLKSQVNILNNK